MPKFSPYRAFGPADRRIRNQVSFPGVPKSRDLFESARPTDLTVKKVILSDRMTRSEYVRPTGLTQNARRTVFTRKNRTGREPRRVGRYR